ncbi:hypothetical protein PTKIN_Ptkin14bG0105300 [Pterospermum kingtungense]
MAKAELRKSLKAWKCLTYLDLYAASIKEVPSGLLPKLSRLQCSGFHPSIKAEEVVALEKLELFWGRFKDMDEFKKFVQPIPLDLRNCYIRGCRGIEFVLSSYSILFQSLEKLSLINLPGLNELIKVEGFASAGSPVLAPTTATFSHLKTIKYRRVLEYKDVVCALVAYQPPRPGRDFCGGFKSGVLVCDSLEWINVFDCKKLKYIPPFLPLHGDGQPYTYAPPSLKIRSSREWWESLEWDHPNFKNVLQPLWHEK